MRLQNCGGEKERISWMSVLLPPFVRIWLSGHMQASGKAVEAGVKGPGQSGTLSLFWHSPFLDNHSFWSFPICQVSSTALQLL